MIVSKEVVVVGQNISVDEQDIGFHGARKDKQRIIFKKVGDGLMVDALYADGFTFNGYFRNQVALRYWTNQSLSPLQSIYMNIFQQLPGKSY